MQDDFFGTNVGNNDGADEEAFVANESGNTLKTAIGSCSTTSDGFSLPPLPSGQNVDIDVHIDSQHNLSLPPEPEGLHMSGSSMPPFTQGSRVNADDSSTIPIGDNDSDSEDDSDDDLDDLVLSTT